MKLWNKGTDAAKMVEAFTVGMDRELDLLLAPWDVLGSIAHIRMLESIDLLKKEERLALEQELQSIYTQIEAGQFEIEEGVEDVHSQVEWLLTQKLGDIGKKIHSGRSRNDQVLVDLKLLFRAEILEIKQAILQLFDQLQTLSEQYKDRLLPGYTHMQIAMPSSFGLWFGAYAESLVDDMQLLSAAFKVVNQNPLGSGAGYGSSFPLNREMTTALLAFETMSYNVVYAQMGRGKTEQILAYALASLAGSLNKLASDVCHFMCQNMGFISFPDALTTGSSIMPHKKNPDVFELIRAKTNQLMSLPLNISHLCSNLSSGYHRDLQLTKEMILPAIESSKACLEMTVFMLKEIIVHEDILDAPIYDHLFSVEVVNQAVLDGLPFREAYQKVGQQIAVGDFEAPRQLHHSHEGSMGNLATEAILQKMTQTAQQIDSAWQEKIRMLLET